MSRRRHTGSTQLFRVVVVLSLASAASYGGSSGTNAAKVSVSSALDCSKPLDLQNGNHYDLSPLAKRGSLTLNSSYDTPPTTTIYTIDVSLCSALDSNSAPAGERCPAGTRICQRVRSKPKIGSGDGLVTHVVPLVTEPYGYKIVQEGDDATSASPLELTLHGPEYAARQQKVKLEMICDRSATETLPDFRGYELMDGKAELRWRASVACPLSHGVGGRLGSGNMPSATPVSEGWGFLSTIFFLTLFLIAYFAIGTYLNNQRYGVMEIPHRDFWRELPYLVMDVGRHTWKSISGQGVSGSSRPGGYEAL